jgi:hypothetical protein
MDSACRDCVRVVLLASFGLYLLFSAAVLVVACIAVGIFLTLRRRRGRVEASVVAAPVTTANTKHYSQTSDVKAPSLVQQYEEVAVGQIELNTMNDEMIGQQVRFVVARIANGHHLSVRHIIRQLMTLRCLILLINTKWMSGRRSLM